MKPKVLSHIEKFTHGETTAGLLLMGAAALALVVANSPASHLYDAFIAWPVTIGLAPLTLTKASLLWINDGLMAIFFLLVGLEIKREVVSGELSTRATAALPLVAALGGMAGPAIVYAIFNAHDSADLKGWAIPTATDIAFALGILALVGSRVPASLKVFLTALAVIDDLGAIAIIAVFYTLDLSTLALAAATICGGLLLTLNRAGVRSLIPYLLVGALLWMSVLKSGVHATMAGVITALAIPSSSHSGVESPLVRLETALHPYVTFAILPLFAFANAGVDLAGVTREAVFHRVTVGIAFGLFIGKQAGVLAAIFIARSLGLARAPKDASALQVYGIAVLTGVGFTMSLFIGTLAFAPPQYAIEVKIGVLLGSFISGVTAYLLLRLGGASGQEGEERIGSVRDK